MTPCMRCGLMFERKRHGPRPKYCSGCKKILHNEWRQDRQASIESDRAVLHEVANNLREYVTPEMWVTIGEYIADMGASSVPALVADRMPDGTASNAGPDEGVSTTRADLAQELEDRRMRAIMDEWFEAHPHWLEGVNDR